MRRKHKKCKMYFVHIIPLKPKISTSRSPGIQAVPYAVRSTRRLPPSVASTPALIRDFPQKAAFKYLGRPLSLISSFLGLQRASSFFFFHNRLYSHRVYILNRWDLHLLSLFCCSRKNYSLQGHHLHYNTERTADFNLTALA